LVGFVSRTLGQAAPSGGGAAGGAPNILVILSDDMGFSALGCYGGEIQTPNLDRLAAGGLRFTQFYNTARCCPTRASLLTGLYPHQAGVGHMMNDAGFDGYRGDLNRTCVTIPEVLRPAGYATYAVGKWHVTRFTQPNARKHNWPLQRGFERYYGTIVGAGNYFDPAGLTRDNTMISALADPEYRPDQYYYTDAISEHAVRFIEDHVNQRPAGVFIYPGENLSGDFNQIGFQLPLIPALENFTDLGGRHTQKLPHEEIGLTDQLHITVLDAVMYCLDEMACSPRSQISTAGFIVSRFGGNGQ